MAGQPDPTEKRNDQPKQLVEHFFRHESAKLVAVLTRGFGFVLVDVVEDMVQESMLEALRSWRIQGIPDNPSGWLHRVARNRILDYLRRDRKQSSLGDSDSRDVYIEVPGGGKLSLESDEIQDSVLRLIFACCHPTLDRSSQLALTLKLVCGLSDHEIARGLLISDDAAKKRVTRAKRTLQLGRVQLDLPPMALLNERLDAVHEVLYLMFNEGYCATRGDLSVKMDLCEEAARLCHNICQTEIGLPTTRALLALILFHAARLESRLSHNGAMVLLADQDRSLWDRDMMRVADYWLSRSANGTDLTRFHLEAGIARIHCHAESVETTDWEGIVRHYDMLIAMNPSPVYEINRAIGLGQVGRIDEGLESLTRLTKLSQMQRYPLLDCAIADLMVRSGKPAQAIQHLKHASTLVDTPHQLDVIKHRIQSISDSFDD